MNASPIMILEYRNGLKLQVKIGSQTEYLRLKASKALVGWNDVTDVNYRAAKKHVERVNQNIERLVGI